uniref:Uncharacterized protein n=1 Tax=Romanomermis culicivorax TaxID=13658 RepID=A0A915IU50_ROMCU
MNEAVHPGVFNIKEKKHQEFIRISKRLQRLPEKNRKDRPRWIFYKHRMYKRTRQCEIVPTEAFGNIVRIKGNTYVAQDTPNSDWTSKIITCIQCIQTSENEARRINDTSFIEQYLHYERKKGRLEVGTILHTAEHHQSCNKCKIYTK